MAQASSARHPGLDRSVSASRSDPAWREERRRRASSARRARGSRRARRKAPTHRVRRVACAPGGHGGAVAFFDAFTLEHVDGGAGATLRVRHGGDGPPVVLLHGHPRTHATWHMVAAPLADHHTVVCPDLRGYGESTKAAPYTKRAMAQDIVGVMR